MENYKNIQNLPNSPLTPLTPLRENRSFNFKFGGDKSLDAYMRDTPFIVNNPVECRSECSGKLTHPSDEFQCIYKKPLESSSNVLNLRSSCASLLPLQFETTAVRHEVVNKSLSPRLAKLLHQRNLIQFSGLFESEEIDTWVFCHLEREDLIQLGIKDGLHIDMVMSAIKYAKRIYGNFLKLEHA